MYIVNQVHLWTFSESLKKSVSAHFSLKVTISENPHFFPFPFTADSGTHINVYHTYQVILSRRKIPHTKKICKGTMMSIITQFCQDIFKNSIRDARTPQPGGIVFNTMRYRSSETVHRLGYFQSSVSVQIMFKFRK